MMKSPLIILFLLIAVLVKGQTNEIEMAALYGKFTAKEMTKDRYSALATRWNRTLESLDQYPDLPLDEDSVVHYTYVNDFPGSSKEQLFNQTLEFLAIQYGLYPSFMYANKEDGRIIFDNSFEIIKNYTGFYTGIITVIDEKIVFEFINLSYQAFFEGHYSGNVWVDDKTVNTSIDKAYPIILKDPAHWKLYLTLFEKTNSQVLSTIGSFRDFHFNYPLKRKL